MKIRLLNLYLGFHPSVIEVHEFCIPVASFSCRDQNSFEDNKAPATDCADVHGRPTPADFLGEQRTLPATPHSSSPLLATDEAAFYDYCDHVGEQPKVTRFSAFDFDEMLPLSESTEFETED
jgi:hypothetical protein